MTAAQLGEYLAGLSEADVVELVETTDIPYQRVEGHLRFRLDEIKVWITANTVPARGAPLSLEQLIALYGD